MPEPTVRHVAALGKALAALLGAGDVGAMAYVRCLPPEILGSLLGPQGLSIPGWEVFGVGGPSPASPRFVSADRAVDLRERKEGNILLLVDPRQAGAGMDGIYSAVREITERELLESATDSALPRRNRELKELASHAIRQSRRLVHRSGSSPWREFLFRGFCGQEPGRLGEYVSLLGLWPIAVPAPGAQIRKEDLEVSSQMVERLLLASGSEATVQARVSSLFLPASQREEAKELETFLTEVSALRWSEAILRVPANLWLNRIQPGFIGQELRAIEVVSWRARPGGAPSGWSGLQLKDDQLVFSVPEDPADRERTKLQVRWKTIPGDLAAGAVTFQVSVVTGSGHSLAARQVTHSGRGSLQKCVVTIDDFEDLDEGGKWEAFVRVHPLGEAPPDSEDKPETATSKRTEDFIIASGGIDERRKTATGRRVRALVEEAIHVPEEEFGPVCDGRRDEDARGFVALRVGARSARVHRPPLLRAAEESWRANELRIGRWIVRVRDDGSPAGDVSFEALTAHTRDPDSCRRLEDATRALARQWLDQGGFVGAIYHENDAAKEYVNAWSVALEDAAPQLALANTIEVQRVSGQMIGLIVLPYHPIRVAWHQAYDELARHARYQEGLAATEVVRTLGHLDGSYSPMFLPGLVQGETFVFGDMLGFTAVGMIRAEEPEPQAAVAHLARSLSPGRESLAGSVGTPTSEAIATEIAKYGEVHPDYAVLRLSAVRAGDAFIMARALGSALRRLSADGKEDDELGGSSRTRLSAFKLHLFPSKAALESGIVGRFLLETAERRRSGAGTLAPEDEWMTERVQISGVRLPRLMWSKRPSTDPDDPAHVAVAFDTFSSSVIGLPAPEGQGTRPIEAYGLFPSMNRSYSLHPVPRWRFELAREVEGAKHPAGRGLTERLHKLHSALMRCVTTNLGHPSSWWPSLGTEVTADRADSLRGLHELSDWVVTVDRNMGLEYFDSPREAPEIYDTYIIDSVPERQDLDCVQLVTSTIHVDEVLRLLDRGLSEMGLSFSPRHCAFLLSQLKALSGRLAMRFTYLRNRHRELIALALFYANCRENGNAPDWLPAAEGFFVPLDDVQDLLPRGATSLLEREGTIDEPTGDGVADQDQAGLRADLAYVRLSTRGSLRLSLVEVKYRRLLRTALAPDLVDHALQQLRRTRALWLETYFAGDLKPTQRVVRRRRLARALRFYCEKAQRHGLDPTLSERLGAAIDRLHDPESDVASDERDDRAYIFCPEHEGPPRQLRAEDGFGAWLFGPAGIIPLTGLLSERPFPEHATADLSAAQPSPARGADPSLPHAESPEEGGAPPPSEPSGEQPVAVAAPPVESPVLGHTLAADKAVRWGPSIQGNPHLMIVGRPGMGKTTCIVSLCSQLAVTGLNPVLFSYHPDLEARLEPLIGPLRYVDIGGGLGFDPLRVVSAAPHGWIDNVGMIRDIFASIYPDLGDIQTNELRECIKQSYVEKNYGVGPQTEGLPVPRFDRFYQILKERPKPNKGLVARLDELNDYGLFRTSGGLSNLLEATRPVVVQLHTTPNEVVQNFVASFVLLSIYQAMFLRGEQQQLSHAIVVDEAHRASRLRLLPTMAKECRKFGLSLVVASQEAKDFQASLFAAVANYLVLNVAEADAQILARHMAPAGETSRIASELRSLPKFTAYFFTEGKRPSRLRLRDPYGSGPGA